MNYWKNLGLCLALIAGHSATADIKTITLASEIALNNFRVPASASGVASFKACESCKTRTVNVTTSTRYEINKQAVTLQNFRKSLSTVVNRKRATVIVMHHLESDVITSISVDL
jgi:biopolymer transport protein ExbD